MATVLDTLNPFHQGDTTAPALRIGNGHSKSEKPPTPSTPWPNTHILPALSIPASASSSRPATPSPFQPGAGVRARTPQLIRPSLGTSAALSSFLAPLHEPATVAGDARAALRLGFGQAVSFVISAFFLGLVVTWASCARIAAELPRWWWKPVKPVKFPWDNEEYWRGEKVVKDVQYYARAVGFDILDEECVTDDGFMLRMHHVINPRHTPHADGRGGFPVLILHGLFQSSGSFITSEERSLAFWLSEHGGYDVFLGNSRGVFDMGHRDWKRNDPRFWDWTIRELAMYDLPAMVDYVCRVTGYEKIAFIGHSQGNGIAFLTLSQGIRPDIGDKLSIFIALAPAVYAGPLTHGFPFTVLKTLQWKTWTRIFGVLDFIPLMRWAYDWVPARFFAMMGYTMFAFLFQWTDANWLPRRKTKMFRFTPTPVSSASIFWWCGAGGFADTKCTMNERLDHWWDAHFPPLSIFWGGRDYLVLTEPLLRRIEEREKTVKLLRVQHIDPSEHCDFYWAADAVEWCFGSLLEDIEKTRLRYPEEMDGYEDGATQDQPGEEAVDDSLQ